MAWRLEEAINRTMAQMAEPDRFKTSYYVPPGPPTPPSGSLRSSAAVAG